MAVERPTVDTEVFYMAGRQLPELATLLQRAGWPADTPALVVSHAGRPDALSSEHLVAQLAEAAAQHAERPTIVVVGAGGSPLCSNPAPGKPERAA
jgi:uroporphyrin-III C-methyltransferase